MVNEKLTSVSLFIYLLAWVMYTVSYLRNERKFFRIPFFLSVFALLTHAGGFVARWIESYRIGAGHFPVANLYEALVFFAMAMGAIFVAVDFKYRIKWNGTIVLPIIFITLSWASFLEKDIEPLVPALQSNWLTVHVITSFLGYAGFAISFGAGILFLLKRETNPALSENLDNIMYISIASGFISLTLGIITGAVWANYAWGSYWSWDPKETWSLITWLVYGAILHGRLTAGWKGKRTAWMAIVGFAITIFCFLGVNLFLSGLHSYAG